MLVQCVKCDATAEFTRRSNEKPRGAFAQAEQAGWQCRFNMTTGSLWFCPKHAPTKAVSDAR